LDKSIFVEEKYTIEKIIGNFVVMYNSVQKLFPHFSFFLYFLDGQMADAA